MRAALLLAVLPALAMSAGRVPPDRDTRIGFHDNDRPAGVLRDGRLTVDLELRLGTWHPNGDDHPGPEHFAWAEAGQPLTIPGPLLRVPQGTAYAIRVRNQTDSTLIVTGLGERASDTLVLAPGAQGRVEGVAARAGNRIYGAHLPSRAFRSRGIIDAQAVGAFIVDAPDAAARRGAVQERVIVMTAGFYSRDSTGAVTNEHEMFAMNGRPWPRTQRLRAAVGDSLRFLLINASADNHPMHLHGAYYRVEARGDQFADTAYLGDAQRLVVTELMTPMTTMTMAWSPERPGTWLMHCHLTFHVVANLRFGAERLSTEAYEHMVVHGPAGVPHDDHVERAMGGLMMAIEVAAPAGWRLPSASRHVVRMEIPDDSMPGERQPVFAPRVIDGGRVAPPLRRAGPGAVLLLRQGEPTAVRVVNRSRDHVAMHWHGMELESFFDGVVGMGGTPGRRMHAIAPADSFDALMTPPRAGTFIYHTHLTEVRQQEAGLYGAMLVLPRDEPWDPTRDHVFVVGTHFAGGSRLNGDTLPPPLDVSADVPQRLRFINITTGNPFRRFTIVGPDSAAVRWTPLAKDGMDLPASRRQETTATVMVSMGETYDMRWQPGRPGEYWLEVRTLAGVLVSRQALRAR